MLIRHAVIAVAEYTQCETDEGMLCVITKNGSSNPFSIKSKIKQAGIIMTHTNRVQTFKKNTSTISRKV
jgi:hypothetical protein